jgi:hypothetical protein
MLKVSFCRYHCMYEEVKSEHDPKEEFEFEEQSKLFLASFEAMKLKYKHLLLKQSQVKEWSFESRLKNKFQ